ncbi:PepSY-associated TM helix domain-containing protein [Paracidovorax wautersii]|uniref:Iron-regulated membrane protein n=1 Tax=Paracidovorax wautersii TaxID=1177982 RepID=A0ABU1IHG3_9BURK|nr:PepSY-associated TM helix domain-containing protein [Paracidovorax wautersii]MDR6215863.1 putative iron-regulated membrane protein [Paracidovorax wautersii]
MATRRASLRGTLVVAHRVAGLALAAFLLVAGLTGSVLAWNAELDAALNPHWLRMAPASADAPRLHGLALRDAVQARYPGAVVARVPLAQEPGRAAVFWLRPQPGAAALDNDQVFVDPYTGRILGERRWGDLSQTWRNLVPFLYRLHYSLALGSVGTWLLGLVSLLWMVDSVVGAYLTLPARASGAARGGKTGRAGWAARWARSWQLDLGSRWRATFDLHRAGGLWLWPALFVLAWSSFALNLPQWHDPLLQRVVPQQPALADLPRRAAPLRQPALDWPAAHQRARELMHTVAAQRGFTVLAESSLAYDPGRGLYRYDVRSSLDIKDQGGSTRLFLDAGTGALVLAWLPTGGAAGDTFVTWMSSLHMAAVGGWPYKLAVTLAGAGVALLSVTGVLIWRRKARARRMR